MTRARWAFLAVTALTLAGAALRLVVAGQSLFADELATYWIVSGNGLDDVLSTVHSNAEISPPLGFVASWLTTRVDNSPELVRAPALVAGVLTIPLVYMLGRRTLDRAAGVAAAAFTALAPFMVYYSAEARGYGLLMAFVAASTLTMLMAVEERRARWWVAYGACSCAAAYTHYTCIFVLGVQLLWLLWAHPEARRPALLANAVAALAYLPWISGLRRDLDSPTTAILSELQPFDFLHVRLSLEHWSVGYPYSAIGLRDLPGVPALVLLAAAVVVAVAAVALRRPRPRLRELVEGRRGLLLVLALALAAPVGAAAFSAVGSTTLFSTRNLAPSWPGLALALAALLVAAGPRLRFATAGLAVASFALGAAGMLDDDHRRPDYEAAASQVEREARPGDVVIDETGVISPGPLTHLDPLLDPSLRIVRSRVPDDRTRPFNVFHVYVTPERAVRRAVAAARGRKVLLVTDVRGAREAPSLRGYRTVAERQYPGLLTIVVRTYARS